MSDSSNTKAEIEKKEESTDGGEDTTAGDDNKQTTAEEEEIDIDLNDPDVEAAAAKIQSAFKNRKGFGKK